MKLLGLDFESSGLPATECRIIEMGAVLFDWGAKAPIEIFNVIVDPVDWGPMGLSPEAVKTHGMTKEFVKEHGIAIHVALPILSALMARADYVVAHNGNVFDRVLLAAECRRWNLVEFGEKKPWIDTMTDVPFPERMTTRKLDHLAAEHRFLNPFPHRAAFDVMTMLQVLTHYDIETVTRNALSPTVVVRAMTNFDQKELAKARRYRWVPDRKEWHKTLKEFDLEKEQAEAPFKVVVVSRTVGQALREPAPPPQHQEPAVGCETGSAGGVPGCGAVAQ